VLKDNRTFIQLAYAMMGFGLCKLSSHDSLACIGGSRPGQARALPG